MRIATSNEIKRTLPKPTIKLLLDNRYWLPSFDEMIEIIEKDWTDRKKYVADRYDCDDFSFSFKAHVAELGYNNVAVVFDPLPRHAYNLFVTDDLKLYVFEPQTDEFWLFENRPRRKYPCFLSLVVM